MLMISSATPTLTTKQTFHDSTDPACPMLGNLCAQKKQKRHCYISCNLKDHDRLLRAQNRHMLLHCENNLRRQHLQLLVPASIPNKDLWIESVKHLPFPTFVKEGSQVTVETPKGYKVHDDSGIKYGDLKDGEGVCIEENQKVSLCYKYYNQSAVLIDYGTDSLDHLTAKFGKGFKEGIKGMQHHGIRRIIIPLSMGISEEDYGVFDVKLLSIEPRHWWHWIRDPIKSLSKLF